MYVSYYPAASSTVVGSDTMVRRAFSSMPFVTVLNSVSLVSNTSQKSAPSGTANAFCSLL